MFKLDLTVVSETQDFSQLMIKLHNLSENPVSDWKLYFSAGRYIVPETVTGGSLTQTGSLCSYKPEKHGHLLPGDTFIIELGIFTYPLRFFSHGFSDAYLSVGELKHPVNLPPIQLLKVCAQIERIPEVPASLFPVIPRPNGVITGQGHYQIEEEIGLSSETVLAAKAIDWLSEEITMKTGVVLNKKTSTSLTFIKDKELKGGSYNLEVTEERINITSGDESGFLYASATLLQLLNCRKMNIPAVSIYDSPRYQYRGMMLDCARHFFPVCEIKSLLNQLAYYKINYFHWHLTDDEGWRIQIDAFPELTDTGAWRGPGQKNDAQYSQLTEKYGGFYSKSEIREVVDFAQERGITVIPEIDMPGHCRAAIKSLPHLLEEPEDSSDYRSIQCYKDNILNPGLEGTYLFIDKVLEEVAELFPSPYIHIGGDEVPENVWIKSPSCVELMNRQGYYDTKELQGHLLRYAENKLKSLNKRMLGWEEVHYGEKVSKETVICSWQSEDAALKCASEGFDVIMQPAQYLYLDMVQGHSPYEPGVDWLRQPVSLKQTYQYEPLQNLKKNSMVKERILGIQCPIWSEYICDQERLDFMLYPRLLAVAEAAWSEDQNRNWEEFLSRLKGHLPHLDSLNINYRNPWNPGLPKTN